MSDRKVFQDSVTALPDQPGLTQHGLMVNAVQPDDGKQTMKILFSLAIASDAQADLEQRVSFAWHFSRPCGNPVWESELSFPDNETATIRRVSS